jgi:dTDP-4-amino-4,6-dideoxygalactose transaminase
MGSKIPVIAGGKPIRDNYLVFGRPLISEDEISEVVDTLRSGWLSTGPKTSLFEERFSAYIGSRFACGLNSCTAGLHLGLIVAGVKEGGEVITTPMTFCATSNAILHLGARPVFVDIRRDDYNLDPAKIEEKITPKTRAILPVHLYGHPADMDEILRIAQKYNLSVISDCAHALETEYKGTKVGRLGDLAAFSFYATKNVTTGEGGMVTTDNPSFQEKLMALRLHGLSADAWKRYSKEGTRGYDLETPGYKYNMTDIQAGLGLRQLEKVEKYLKIREGYWQMYNQSFGGMEEIVVPPELTGIRHARHLYPILIKTELLKIDRDRFRLALHEENIGTGIHFQAVHLFSYYQKTFGFKRGDFPIAEYVGDRTISLPLSPGLSPKDITDVIAAVKGIVEYYRPR